MQGQCQSARARTNLGRSTHFYTLSSGTVVAPNYSVLWRKWHTRNSIKYVAWRLHPNPPMQDCVLTRLTAKSTSDMPIRLSSSSNTARYLSQANWMSPSDDGKTEEPAIIAHRQHLQSEQKVYTSYDQNCNFGKSYLCCPIPRTMLDRIIKTHDAYSQYLRYNHCARLEVRRD